ncbi:MAG: holo-ACP synthase [Chloroflexi bacterium]|nr:holo-ACP synthase [Chloroflexota bacterium]
MTQNPTISAGVDIIEISRIQEALSRWGERFLSHIYLPAEVKLCRGKAPAFAVRFAGKEAVMKALGTGARGVGWRDIEVLADQRGKPVVHLHGRAEARARELGIAQMEISLSHSREYAVAFVVATIYNLGSVT